MHKDRFIILHETAAHLRSILGDEMDTIYVQRAVIGLFFSGIKLSNGEGGICFTPVKEIPEAVCCPSSLRVMPDTGRLTGRSVNEYISYLSNGGPLQIALVISVLNALSATCWHRTSPENYYLRYGIDPVENKIISDSVNVVIIGALVPYIRMLKQRGQPFHILEKDTRTLKPDELKYYCPPEKSGECIRSADLLIITGTTLINDTLTGILSQARSRVKVVLVGPTASMLPEAFFSRGVNAIGGVVVTDADAILDTLTEAGSGYHFYNKSAERLVIDRDKSRILNPDITAEKEAIINSTCTSGKYI